MSKAIGIVAEYNPFHNGHAHHLREAKRIAGNRPVIAAMSGSLVQRGLPALTDKWTRARMAVLGGVDLDFRAADSFHLSQCGIFCCRSCKITGCYRDGIASCFWCGSSQFAAADAHRRIFERTCFSGRTASLSG